MLNLKRIAAHLKFWWKKFTWKKPGARQWSFEDISNMKSYMPKGDLEIKHAKATVTHGMIVYDTTNPNHRQATPEDMKDLAKFMKEVGAVFVKNAIGAKDE